MQRKAEWMEPGAIVVAGGQKGKITAVNPIMKEGSEYVEYINVKLDGARRAKSFAGDVKQYGLVQQELFSPQP